MIGAKKLIPPACLRVPFRSIGKCALAAAAVLAMFTGPMVETSSAAQQPVRAQPAQETKLEAAAPLAAGAFEERFGIRVTLVGVSGGGGLIDFRFKILNKEKAKELFKDPHQLPVLMTADSGLTLTAPHHMAGNIRLQDGAVCFLLYPNARNAVKVGTPVSAVFGGYRVEPVNAQ